MADENRLLALLHGPSTVALDQAHDLQSRATDFSPIEFAMGLVGPRVGGVATGIRAYHASTSPAPFDTFKRRLNDVGVHFGTAEQANNRLDYITTREGSKRSMEGAHVIPVDLDIKNPLRLNDLGAWGSDNLEWGLRGLGWGEKSPSDEIGRAMRSARNEAGKVAALRDVIHRKGYDGIVYKNDGEVAGAQPYQAAQDAAWLKVKEANKRGELPINGFSEQDREHPAYKEWSKAIQDSLEFRTKNAEDSYIATKRGTVRNALTGKIMYALPPLALLPAASESDPTQGQ